MSTFFRKNSYCADLDRSAEEILALAKLPRKDRPVLFSGFTADVVRSYIARVGGFIETCMDLGREPLQKNSNRAAELLLVHLRRKHDQGEGFAVLQPIRTAVNTWYTTRGKAIPRSQALSAFCYAVRKEHRVRRATPVTPEKLFAMCRHAMRTRPPLQACRDVALLMFGFSSADRPVEVRTFAHEHIDWDPDDRGIVVNIPRSKGDQDGDGQTVTIPAVRAEFCPVKALKNWLEMSGIESGIVFRSINRFGKVGPDKPMSYEAYRKIMRSYLLAVGITGKPSGYSMRRGWATSARQRGASRGEIREHLRHKEEETTGIYIDHLPIPFERSLTRMILT